MEGCTNFPDNHYSIYCSSGGKPYVVVEDGNNGMGVRCTATYQVRPDDLLRRLEHYIFDTETEIDL